MPLSPDVASSIDRAVDACAQDLLSLSRRIHGHPELHFEEHKASAAHAASARISRPSVGRPVRATTASAPAAPTWETCREAAGRTAVVVAKALARTAIELIADAELRAAVSAEWRDRAR